MAFDKTGFSSEDLRGLSRLGFTAAVGLTDLVEQMHHTILRAPLPLGAPIEGPARGLTGFVYRCIRGVMRAAGGGVDAALSLLGGSSPPDSSRARDVALAVLNGVVGDHLQETNNPLALEMQLRRDGRALPLDRASLARDLPQATGRLLVLVHGLCMSDWQWTRDGHDHGAALGDDHGFTPIYLFYNSGRHISENGRGLAELLERLVASWPVAIEDFVILGHSMGGLLARSALRHGGEHGHEWPRRLRKLVFLGTPHHGAPLEKIGSWVDLAVGKTPYTAAFRRLGKIRSAGVTDLRDGALTDADWRGRDRFARRSDPPSAVPLPPGLACYAVAGSLAMDGGLRDSTLGDGLVPVASALGHSDDPARTLDIPPDRKAILRGVGHLDLLGSQAAYEKIRDWLAP
jgi:hypothetical protein